jgi:5-methylcytosine-specific restriction endonuclease McrA
MNLNEFMDLPLVLNEWPTPEDYKQWFKGKEDHPITCEEFFSKRYVKKVVELRYWRSRLSEAQNHKCCWCGGPVTEIRNRKDSSTIEHVVCRSKGGPDHPDNYAIACDDCNNKRGDMEANDFQNQKLTCTSA